MRTITVVTTSRADYGIYGPVLRRVAGDPELGLDLLVTGSHLAPTFGYTVDRIERDGYRIRDRIECLMSSDSAWSISQSMALTMLGFSQSYARQPPELLLVLGDRFEMFAAVAAAVPMKIPIAHIHGGESTEGAIDEAFRHAITKMSHLHFAATEQYRDRILQLGEHPERVFHCGAPSLDNLLEIAWVSQAELAERLGLSLDTPPLLVTLHPVTLQHDLVEAHCDALLKALERTDLPVVFTYPNADTGGQTIIRKIEQYVARRPQAVVATDLGTEGYFSLMRHAGAMVGNSSSGIIEAASFELPVVNIGIRQSGRVRGANVIDCDPSEAAITKAIETAVSGPFRAGLRGLRNPYGDGRAAERIVEQLKRVDLDDDRLFHKQFYKPSL